MEWHVVVVALSRQELDALCVLRREVVPQLDDDTALGGVDHDGVGLVETCRQCRRLGDSGSSAKQRGKQAEDSDHNYSGAMGPAQPANLAFRRAAIRGGTNAEM